MSKIKDRITLGMVSGLIGTLAKTATDEFFLRNKTSKRSFRVTASGVWVDSKRQASSPYGQTLGAIMDLGLGMVSAVGQVYILSKTGKNNLFAKGSLFGMTFGATITAMLSGFGSNKVKPKDAKSNLTYIFSSGVFGLVTTYAAALLGDDSLWDVPPANNYLPPTQQTTAEKAGQVPIPPKEASNSNERPLNSNY